MKRLALTAAVTMLGGALCAAPEDATPTPAPILSTEMSGSDLGFFMGAARQAELLARLSELAKAHAVTPEVQALAAAVLKDQTDAAVKLKSLAERKHAPLGAEPDRARAQLVESLGKLKGPRFDKSYLDALGDAQDALETSLNAGAGSSDAEIKALAEADLATLKQEQDRVRKLGL
jgi:predicted outer membrane protein